MPKTKTVQILKKNYMYEKRFKESEINGCRTETGVNSFVRLCKMYQTRYDKSLCIVAFVYLSPSIYLIYLRQTQGPTERCISLKRKDMVSM